MLPGRQPQFSRFSQGPRGVLRAAETLSPLSFSLSLSLSLSFSLSLSLTHTHTHTWAAAAIRASRERSWRGAESSRDAMWSSDGKSTTVPSGHRYLHHQVFKAHRLLYHSALGLRAIKKKKGWVPFEEGQPVEACSHQTSERYQIVFFNCPDLYHKSPDSGKRQYKSRT